jgi:hypothetical protein
VAFFFFLSVVCATMRRRRWRPFFAFSLFPKGRRAWPWRDTAS